MYSMAYRAIPSKSQASVEQHLKWKVAVYFQGRTNDKRGNLPYWPYHFCPKVKSLSNLDKESTFQADIYDMISFLHAF